MLTDEERDYQDVIRKLQNIDILSTRISTNKIRLLAECVKKPCDPLPENPLPRWKTIPLDEKFPVIPCAPGQFPFSRNTISKSLFRCACSSEFDTEDPYIRQTPIEYNPLHDPNLKIYFQEHPQLLRNLERRGFINNSGNVICSTSDYNKYREYLSRIHKRTINKERKRLEDVADADFKQVKSIKHYLFKESNVNREAAAKARMEESRAAQAQRHLRTQFRKVHHPSTKYREQLARERACLRQRHEYLRQKKQAKLEQMNEEQLNHNRHVVLEWYCRDIYFQRLRQALVEYKKTVHRVDMEDFVKCKREYQEEKVRYERAIRFRVKTERECSVIKRKERYARLEIFRKESLKRKAENEQKKADRDLFLMRKYGRKWLAIVEAKRKAVSTYHDSLWATRGQLREVVAYLREESGTQSFTGFIQDIIKLKPGRQTIVMSEGTKEVVEYIMKTLLEAAYKEYIRKTTSTALDFLDQETLDQLERVKCRKGDVIRVEDFIPPVVRRRFKPQIPFIRPPWPCCGPCAGLNVKEKDADWEQRCREMACCLETIHNEISNFLTDRMCRAMENTVCKELGICLPKPKSVCIPCRPCTPFKPCVEEEPEEEPPCFIDSLCEEAHYISDGEIQRMARKKKPSSTIAIALTREALAKIVCKTMDVDMFCENATLLSETEIKRLIDENGADSPIVAEALANDALIRSVCKDRIGPDGKFKKRDSSGPSSSGRDSRKSDVGSESGGSDLSETAEGAVKNAIKQSIANLAAEGKGALPSGGNVISSSAYAIEETEDTTEYPKTSESGGFVTSPDATTSSPESLSSLVRPSQALENLSEEPIYDADGEGTDYDPRASSSSRANTSEQDKGYGPWKDGEPVGREPPESSGGATETEQDKGYGPWKDGEPVGREPPESSEGDPESEQDKSYGPWKDGTQVGRDPPDSSKGPDTSDKGYGPWKDGTPVGRDPDGPDGYGNSRQGPDGPRDYRPGKDTAGSSDYGTSGQESSKGYRPSDQGGLSTEDDDWVTRIIEEQRKLLQFEKDVVGEGDENRIDAILSDGNVSRVSSFIMQDALCEEIREFDPCYGEDIAAKESLHPLKPAVSSQMGFVHEIIEGQRYILQRDINSVTSGEDTEINDENISRMASSLDKSVLCETVRDLGGTCPSRPASRMQSGISLQPASSMDLSFVDQVIREQKKMLQDERTAIGVGDEAAISQMLKVCPISRVASELTDTSICKEVQELAADLRSASETSMKSNYSYNGRMVEQIIHNERDKLQSTAAPGRGGPDTYLDPFEQGISPVRSEIRQHLNSIRGELENLKSQLIGQGVIRPPEDPDPSRPS